MKRTLLLLASLCVVAATAHATERDPGAYARVTVHQHADAAGQPGRATVEILSRPGVQVHGVAVVPPRGWPQPALSPTVPEGPAPVSGLARQAFTLDLVAGDGNAPLVLRYLADGQLVEEPFSLATPEVPTGEAIPVYEPVPRTDPAVLATLARPGEEWGRELDRSSSTVRTIRVHGRLVCDRMDPSGTTTLGADGVKVKVLDMEGGFTTGLAEGFTDADGNFDLSFDWDDGDLIDPQPDIRVEFELANSWVQMRTTDITSGNTSFRVGWWGDYTGTDIDMGTVRPWRQDWEDAAYVMTVVARSWRWFDSMGWALPTTTFRFPNDGSTSFFRPLDGVVYLGQAHANSDAVIVHEYGHRWVRVHAQQDDPQYCNNICGDTADDCNHCLWCQETTGTAWSEGFPDALGDFVPRTFASTYAVGGANMYDFEAILACNDSTIGGIVDDPTMTEGIFAAWLVDLVDTNDENDMAIDATWQDRTQLDPQYLMDAAGTLSYRNAVPFVEGFYAWRKGNGATQQELEDIWETSRQNGYELDELPPPNPPTVSSNTHSPGVSTAVNWPTFLWNEPVDDASGIAGYGISITSGSPATPGATQDIGRTTLYRPEAPLAPGTYYFNLRAVDRAGRWASGAVSFGPLVISSPEPLDLAFYTPEFWEDMVVPRDDTDGTSGLVALPDNLVGWSTATYINAGYRNASASSHTATSSWRATVLLDGETRNHFAHGSGTIFGSQTWNWNSTQAFYARGGRHSLAVALDYLDALGESDELDNRYGQQWVWSPQPVPTLGSSALAYRPSPRQAGWDDISGTLWFNADGYRMNSGAGGLWWHAVAVAPRNNDDNPELRLHAASTGPTNGFTTNVGYSTRPAGRLDAVFVNRNQAGAVDWDLGLMNAGMTDSYVRMATAGANLIPYASDITVSLGTDEYLAMRELRVPPGSEGPFSAQLQVDPADGPVTLLWLDDSFTTGDMADYAAAVTTDAEGYAQLDVLADTAGYYCLVLYRDPAHVPEASAPSGVAAAAVPTPAMDISLRTGATPPNLRPDRDQAGWADAFVPRDAPDGTPSSVPAPLVLYGDQAATWLNLATENEGQAPSPASSAEVRLDGVPVASIGVPALGTGKEAVHNGTSPISVPGGRHTLAAMLDPTAAIGEAREDDNSFGAQYVFEPSTLSHGVPVVRALPPGREDGHSLITVDISEGSGVGEGGAFEITPTIYPNCDGVGLPDTPPSGGDDHWLALATMPDAQGNVDLTLFEASAGAFSGFDLPLASSGWPTGQADYVLVNQRETPPRRWDGGIYRAEEGEEGYTACSATSSSLGTNPIGSFGPFPLPAGNIVALHELWLDEGSWDITLNPVGGNVDWGLSLHPGQSPDGTAFLGRDDVVDGGTSIQAPAGQKEAFTVVVGQGQAGYHCLVAFKAAATSLGESGQYELVITNDATGTGDQPPTGRGTRLAVHPNPFNPQATIAFELEREQPVRIDLLNERGSLVRVLHDGVLPAGRRELLLPGRDGAGGKLASGVYLVRLRLADGHTEVRKATLLK